MIFHLSSVVLENTDIVFFLDPNHSLCFCCETSDSATLKEINVWIQITSDLRFKA